MRIRFVITILATFFIFAQAVAAVPAQPSPTCKIIAKVLDVEKTTGVRGSPTSNFRQEFDYYKIMIRIIDSELIKDGEFGSCELIYRKGSEVNSKMSIDTYELNPISKDQTITGQIHFGGDEWWGGYFLSNVETLKDASVNVNTPDNSQNTNTTTDQDDDIDIPIIWYYLISGFTILLVIILFIFSRRKK